MDVSAILFRLEHTFFDYQTWRIRALKATYAELLKCQMCPLIAFDKVIMPKALKIKCNEYFNDFIEKTASKYLSVNREALDFVEQLHASDIVLGYFTELNSNAIKSILSQIDRSDLFEYVINQSHCEHTQAQIAMLTDCMGLDKGSTVIIDPVGSQSSRPGVAVIKHQASTIKPKVAKLRISAK